MNPEKQLPPIDMSYRFKYIAVGLIIYVTVPLMVIAISLKVLVLSVMVQELSSSASKNLAHRQQKLSGLFLDRDVDYRTLLADMEAQFSEEKQSEQEYLAEEIAL
ncbi:10087_t:CDS:2 [Funneliformis geosporum]|nr:10087_t:CDS:2 [Funneliformis geosporum]